MGTKWMKRRPKQQLTAVHPVGPVRTGVPCTRYTPVCTGCYTRSSLCSPWTWGLGGPCARGCLGPPVQLLLGSIFFLVALWSFSNSFGVSLTSLWSSVFVPKDT